MPLTKANSIVLNIDDVSLSLKDTTIANGVRDYIDDQLVVLSDNMTTQINARGDMFKTNNLSDLTNPAAARENLGITDDLLQKTMVFNGRLKAISDNIIRFDPFKGDKFYILSENAIKTIPSGGLTYTLSGLSPNTVYHVYISWNPGTTSLQLTVSTMPSVIDSSSGICVMNGDATKQFIGAFATHPIDIDKLHSRYYWENIYSVESAFNRERKGLFYGVPLSNNNGNPFFLAPATAGTNLMDWISVSEPFLTLPGDILQFDYHLSNISVVASSGNLSNIQFTPAIIDAVSGGEADYRLQLPRRVIKVNTAGSEVTPQIQGYVISEVMTMITSVNPHLLASSLRKPKLIVSNNASSGPVIEFSLNEPASGDSTGGDMKISYLGNKYFD